MGTDDTNPEVYAAAVEFARNTGHRDDPHRIAEGTARYIINSLGVPQLRVAIALWVNGAEFETIDTAWRVGTGAAEGRSSPSTSSY
jgi:3-hydroxyacyl-CoA dehydrogenase